MNRRCKDRQRKDWKDYGGRGIKVCDRWIDSFENFLADMGEKPKGMSLDRINNDGDYSPENCRWASHLAQCRNRRTNVMIEIDGQSKCISEWAEIYHLERSVIYGRLKRGWPTDLAVKAPSGSKLKDFTE